MVVILDLEVPSHQFELGRLFEEFSDIGVELERIVPLRSGIMPLVWVAGADPDAVEDHLRGASLVQELALLTRAEDRHLFEITWRREGDSLVQFFVRHDAEILDGEGTAEVWTFRLQFPDRRHVSAFYEDCRDHDLVIEPQRIYNPQIPAEEDPLTRVQVDTLVTSYEAGYWNEPREIGLEALGDRLGVSDTAVSQRLRRAIKTLIETHVLPEADRH